MSLRHSIFLLLICCVPTATNAGSFFVNEHYCAKQGFSCRIIEQGDSWDTLFADAYQRDLVQQLNRTNVSLKTGQIIAIPDGIETLSEIDISPFPDTIEPSADNSIHISLSLLAWGAYSAKGDLLRWGAISGGKDYCKDVKRECKTRPGNFRVYYKKGGDCISKKFPVGKGGAKMPYCMFYDGGYAMHGSYTVPGYHDSHGCVRMFIPDAKWLNQNFVVSGRTRVVIAEALPDAKREKPQSRQHDNPVFSWH